MKKQKRRVQNDTVTEDNMPQMREMNNRDLMLNRTWAKVYKYIAKEDRILYNTFIVYFKLELIL